MKRQEETKSTNNINILHFCHKSKPLPLSIVNKILNNKISLNFIPNFANEIPQCFRHDKCQRNVHQKATPRLTKEVYDKTTPNLQRMLPTPPHPL